MIDAAVFYIAPERVKANAVSRKRFTGFSFFVLALAEALHERLHAAADRLAAEAEQRKAVQLGIRRHPVRIGRANHVEIMPHVQNATATETPVTKFQLLSQESVAS